jgi:hypothetical protein
MEREDRPYGEPPTQTEAGGQIVDPAAFKHDFKVGDRVKLTHDYTFGDRSYPTGWEGEIGEIDVTTYGATEGVMETLGARVRFDDDPAESAAWAPYTLLEHADAG